MAALETMFDRTESDALSDLDAKPALSWSYERRADESSALKKLLWRRSTNGPPPPESEGVRIVQPAEYKEAAACLADAFFEDHVARYFLDVPDSPDWSEQRKWRLHTKMLEYMTYAHCLKGLVTTVGNNYAAVALW